MGLLAVDGNSRTRSRLTIVSGPVTPSPPVALTFRLFLEADLLGLSDNASVTSWTDYSGNGHHAVTSASSSTTNPTFKTNIVNGQPVIRFNGFSDALDLPTAVYSGLTTAELFIVAAINADPPGASATAGHPLQMGGDSSAKISHWPFTDNNIYESFGTTARKTVGDPASSLTSFRCYNVRTASAAFSAHLNATQLFTTATNTVGFGAYGPYIGHANGATDNRWLYGDIALIAITPAVLSSGDRTTMQTYITGQYGITF